MTKLITRTGLLCFALHLGCGDDKGAMASGATTSQAVEGTDGNSSSSASAGATEAMSTTTGATPGDGTSSSTGCSFICDTTTGEVPMCDVWMQDCPEGQKCMPASLDGDNSWESLICTEVMPGAGKVGDECTIQDPVSGVDSCELGAMCWYVSQDTGKGTCIEQCKGSARAPYCSDPTMTCILSGSGVLNLCLPICDPLAQDCPNMDLCIPNPSGTGFVCVLDASGEEGQEWDPCGYANACDPGLLCVNVALATECDQSADGCCLPFCDLNVMPATCKGAGQECLPFFEMGTAPPGLEHVGVCGLPM